MIDYKPTLKANLEKIGVPVYYELFVDSSTETPCITYIENEVHIKSALNEESMSQLDALATELTKEWHL